MTKRKSRDDSRIPGIVQALSEGKTLAQVGLMFGITKQRVFQLLESRGIEKPGKRNLRWTEQEVEIVKNEYKSPIDRFSLAERLNRHPDSVRKLSYSLGFKFKPGKKPLSQIEIDRRRHHAD